MLYGMEQNMAFFAKELGNNEQEEWLDRAKKRLELMNEFLWNEELGVFCDYDFVNKKQSTLLTPAVFVPLFTGLATKEQASKIVKALDKLETEFGLVSSEYRDDLLDGQWDYPHGWPPSHYIAIRGLLEYGFETEAKRIAKKLKDLMEKHFETTGFLWEKYNVVTGEISITQEYQTPPIMGWCASIYLYCKDLLEKR